MTTRITVALKRLFEKNRIVFWYDDKQELREDFESLQLENVDKIEIRNNEFSIKHRLLREQPKTQFLLYKEDKQPEPLKNWLYDIELANTVFKTDQAAIWLSELELPGEFSELVEKHAKFFEPQGNVEDARSLAELRKQTLKSLLDSDDTISQVRLKMLAIAAGVKQKGDARLDVLLELLMAEQAAGNTYSFIERCNLNEFLWQQVAIQYGYRSDSPSVMDFVFELFKFSYLAELTTGLQGISLDSDASQKQNMTNSSLVFFKRWKDSRTHQGTFEVLSKKCTSDLNIESDLQLRTLNEILDLDYFELIDVKVIHDLVNGVAQRTYSQGEVALWCRQRRQGHWYKKYELLYEAVDVASQFFALLDATQFEMSDASQAVQRYTSQWFKLDQLYRQYIYALKVSSQHSLLGSLTTQIENLYVNNYVQPLTNAWQQHVDAMNTWQVPDIEPQKHFFKKYVDGQYLAKKKKVCVIISDAFRYEAGEEMVSRIRQEDRFEATINHALSSMPSYTQLGMASLLPQSKEYPLQLADNKTGTVLMGELSTQGTGNRDKILKTILGGRASAVKAKDLIENTQANNREIIKANDVLYIYHNRIDHTGDKMQSEGEAFEATEKTFDDLIKLVKKLTNANASNVLITADHGFIYQNSVLDESDYLIKDVEGEILYNDRRFVLGKGLTCGKSLKSFSGGELGVVGDVHAVVPKGIQRLRLSGSGSRFVHGGASLQEVIVPIISINKKRSSDIRMVDVDVLRSGSTVITSGQISVTLYQVDAVTEKTQYRALRLGIYTESGTLISDSHTVDLDLTSDNSREREMKLRFLLNQEADSANNQEVILKLEETVAGTNQFKSYKELRYTIRRSFTSDFDF
ncbi:BREX-1 system phosphatase PglZ type A [Photobacterium frigidiphilum]|uniref:BREX-1 system phosphatase PglZ type A n=1 Tax=Photobacterium frigidiphilum TaxID=264736 RepID=A0A2T3JA69_9GAMM|nr:BREX-1 system phosphatase PglZ type A [Photobacterium frigidiphilum]PSU45721.1 BREX-1 system phosphatase PglZ type A [Photobacterium frigidiphilum]